MLRVDPATDAPDRELLYGGIEYTFALPQASGPRWGSVRHAGAREYWLVANFCTHSSEAVFTRLSFHTDRARLTRAFADMVSCLASEVEKAGRLSRQLNPGKAAALFCHGPL
jgi:hypothetical protein